jgi:hypothetical protein
MSLKPINVNVGVIKCNHEQCKGNLYCYAEAYFNSHIKNQKKLEFGVNPTNTSLVKTLTRLEFCGVEVYLNPDGTYEISHTC